MLKGEYCIRAIDTHNMDQGIVFCRTKLDCDNMERYFNQIGTCCGFPSLIKENSFFFLVLFMNTLCFYIVIFSL